MSDWVARYEEGYVTADGTTITITNEVHGEHPWESPGDAMSHWATRADLAGPGARRVGNGLQQSEHVGERAEFAALHVAIIWRRVTFEVAAARSDTSQMS